MNIYKYINYNIYLFLILCLIPLSGFAKKGNKKSDATISLQEAFGSVKGI